MLSIYGEAFALVIKDLSVEKAKIDFVAEYDRLTGLPNSSVLQYRAEDFLLKNSYALKATIKEELVARVAGNEFLVLLSAVRSRNEVVDVVQTIMTSITESVRYERYELQVKCSIGVALFPEQSHELSELRWKVYSAVLGF